ncbi:PREDICTED: uncharacterized protein LOC107329438 [Acropora digitifera]|uniref:uncharacterized protein LOC107329438 n=1 Tax=Acropora digitifera TaxID=70779 RepID=UPI00077A8507|nr:PREDICTED: uncharacterized protein LOC107329438 [Acropora digitifera]
MYALLRNIVSPRRPRDLSFEEIVDNLTRHLDPKPKVIAEGFKFHKREQQESDSIRDFLPRLKKLAETCEFGGYREEAIRDRLMCGLKERTIQRQLLAVADLILQSVVEKACAAELTEKETIALHGGASKPVDNKLCSYSGHEIFVIGEAKVQVAYRDQKAVLPIVIIGNDGPLLIGRGWLSVLKLDWGQVKRISLEPVDKLDQLRTTYSSLFDGNLGTIKGVTAHLKIKGFFGRSIYPWVTSCVPIQQLATRMGARERETNEKENAVPQFFKPRPVPFPLKEKIAEELCRLEKIGVLEEVEFSDWDTPIVLVLKPVNEKIQSTNQNINT